MDKNKYVSVFAIACGMLSYLIILAMALCIDTKDAWMLLPVCIWILGDMMFEYGLKLKKEKRRRAR